MFSVNNIKRKMMIFKVILILCGICCVAAAQAFPLSWPVTQTLSFGPKELGLETAILMGGPEAGFGTIAALGIDDAGGLYVVERSRVSIWDARGRHLGDIGSSGQGPGEFVMPIGIFIGVDGRIYLNDQGRSVLVYGASGVFEREIRTPGYLKPGFAVTRRGMILGVIPDSLAEGAGSRLVKIGPDGKVVAVLAEVRPTGSAVGSSSVSGGMTHSLSSGCLLCASADGVWFGFNMEYSLRFFEEDGRTAVTIVKDEKRASISGDIADAKVHWGKDYVDRTVKFPPYRPYFVDVLSDEKGRVYVVRAKGLFDKKKSWDMDVFDRRGNILFRLTLPLRPVLIRNGAAYALDQDQEGWPVVVRMNMRRSVDLPAAAGRLK